MNPPKYVKAFLIGPGKLLNISINLLKAFINLVATFKNPSPVVAKFAFNDSIARLNLPEADSVTCAISRFAIPARSEAEAFINSNTCNVCEPCFPKLLNKAFIRANWNLPNNCSNACCFCNGFSLSNAACKSNIVPVTFPAFLFTIPRMSIPNDLNLVCAALVGLIKDARPDFNEFAASPA